MRKPRCLSRLSLCCALALSLVGPLRALPSLADHGADVPGWVEQAGDGKGGNGPLIPNFAVGSVIYDQWRFAGATNGATPRVRLDYPKYLAFGTLHSGTGDQLAMVRGGEEGVNWEAPAGATLITTSSGQSAPFLLGPGKDFFDVIFSPGAGSQGSGTGLFFIFYGVSGQPSTAISQIHQAESTDGVNWTNDVAITQNSSRKLITGDRQTRGPEDVIFNPRPISPLATCEQNGFDNTAKVSVIPSIFNCPVVMIYDLSEGGGGGIGLAFSTASVASGTATQFTAAIHPERVVTQGAPGSWDGGDISGAHVLVRGGMFDSPRSYELYYAGSRAGDSACGGSACSSLGVAVSTDSEQYTKFSSPVTEHSLLEPFAASSPVSLRNPVPVPNANPHQKIYFNAARGDGGSDVLLAYTAPSPPSDGAPRVRIASPVSGGTSYRGLPTIAAYVSDSAGGDALPRDAEITLDGARLPVTSAEPTIVTAMRRPAFLIKSVPRIGTIADGAHVVTVKVSDADGHVASANVTFTVDTTPPVTTLTGHRDPGTPLVGFPGTPLVGFPNGLGEFDGTTEDGSATTGSGILRMRATITDPLGQRRSWDGPGVGFSTSATDAKHWSWHFVAPSLDTFFLVPGEYVVTFGGVDCALNVEGPTTANTIKLLVL